MNNMAISPATKTFSETAAPYVQSASETLIPLVSAAFNKFSTLFTQAVIFGASKTYTVITTLASSTAVGISSLPAAIELAMPTIVTVAQVGATGLACMYAVGILEITLCRGNSGADPAEATTLKQDISRYKKIIFTSALITAVTGVFVGFQATAYTLTVGGLILGTYGTAITAATNDRWLALRILISSLAVVIIANSMLQVPLFAAIPSSSMIKFSLPEVRRVALEIATGIPAYLQALPFLLPSLARMGLRMGLPFASYRLATSAFTHAESTRAIYGCATLSAITAIATGFFFSDTKWFTMDSPIGAGFMVSASLVAVELCLPAIETISRRILHRFIKSKKAASNPTSTDAQTPRSHLVTIGVVVSSVAFAAFTSRIIPTLIHIVG